MKKLSRKVMALTLAFIMALGVAPIGGMIDFDLFGVSVNAASESDLTFKLINDGTEYEVSGCDREASGELIIPSTHNGLPVTSIGDWAFYYCDSVTSITIPDSVASIENEAFAYCDNLTSITIPDSVTSIGNWAFYDCDSLTSITVPNSVTSIGYECFNGCTSLASVAIGNGVTSIGGDSFDDTALYNNNSSWDNGVLYIGNCLIKANEDISDTYAIKEGTQMIADRAFEECTGLTSVSIPDSVTGIGYCAFGYCDGLTKITVSSNNAYYRNDEYGVLYSKDKTELIQYPGGNGRDLFEIPAGVTSIGDFAFMNCHSLTSITISDSVTSIGYWRAFAGCESLSSITIPDSVTSIGGWTFEGCTALESVSIGSGVTDVFAANFEGCFSLTNITVSPDNAYYSSDENGVLYNKDKTELIIYPFGNERTSFQIPNSVTNIASAAFFGCRFLQEINVDSSSKSFSSKDGVLFNKEKTSLIYYPCSKADVYYEIPKGITHIEYGSFSDNTTCEYLVIPDSVTYIGYGEIDAETIIYDGSVEQWYNIECHSYFGEETSLIVAKQNLAIRVLTAFLKMMLKLYNKLNSILISMQ